MGMSQAIVVAVVVMAHTTIGAAEVSRATAVKFHTVCTRYHEGECSGRLSFSSGVAATRSHIQRHIPSSSLEVEELFAILKYTKEHCAHYPLPDAIPANGVWGIETLRQWRSPDGDSYFIPLGRMRRGVYHLGLRFDGKSEASVCMGGRTRKSAQFAVVKAQSRPRAVQPANAVHAKNDGNTS